ncbi:MAG TPA: hypothetical protein VFZ66_06020 [Herpetosiphonaceae bacterium]
MLYFILVAVGDLVSVLVPSLRLAGGTLPGAPPTIFPPTVSIPLTLFLAWGFWGCQAWARALIICVGLPTITLAFLSGNAGFKIWILLAIVLYLVQRRIGEVFAPAPDPLP